MSFASSSRLVIRSISRVPRQTISSQIGRRTFQDFAQPTSSFTLRTLNQRSQITKWPTVSISHYATSAFTNAKPLNHSIASSPSQEGKEAKSSTNENESSKDEGEQPNPDEPPKKATIRERLRFLTRRYGWWALGVYLLASTMDFSLIFLAIHLLGADHIRELEDAVRKYLGMGKREMEDTEVAAWPVPASVIGPGERSDGTLANNEEAAEKAARRIKTQSDVSIGDKNDSKKKGGNGGNNSSTLWTEAVLAYTIHKTLLLPFRVAFTAAVTPTFVKYMVRLGWAKNNAAVQQAAHKAKMAKEAAKKAIESKK